MMLEDSLVLDKLLKAYDKAYYEGRPEQAILLKEQIEKLLGTLPTLPKRVPLKNQSKSWRKQNGFNFKKWLQ